jgi:AraC-like DNA-binding protein
VQANVVELQRVSHAARIASPRPKVFVGEYDQDTPGVSIPRPETHVVVRFGPAARRGLDVYAFGVRERVHRKLLRGGQRTVSARLPLGTAEAVLGVPANAMSGRVVELEELWGDAEVRRLLDRLAGARDTAHAASVLESAVIERVSKAGERSPRERLALEAAERLSSAAVSAVAADLGVSERNLRRVFLETVGIGPKTFAKLMRFQRALHAAREERQVGWANIAAIAGYYDQAHLIAEFNAIAGVTPRALLGELGASQTFG